MIVVPGAAVGYLAVVDAVTVILAPSLPVMEPAAVSAWALVAVLAVLVTAALLFHLAPAIGLGPWRDRLYVAALSAGQQRTPTTALTYLPRPVPGPRPAPRPEGARA